MKTNLIKKKSFDFAIRIVHLFKHLQKEKKEFVLSKQLLRSGTAVGALIREAEHAQSKADFIHKMKIAFKESEELDYWLELTRASVGLPNPNPRIGSLLLEIRKLLSSIISSSKKNL